MKTYLIGIDIGTSGCKIAVFNKAGEVLAAQSGTYPVYYPKPGWAEQNPEDWWNTICQVLPEMLQKAEISPDAVESGADIIMLDNMDNDLLKQSIDYIAGRAEIEISGNVTKENIERIKNFGVNYVSSGALTHSSPIMDISLKNLHAV